jgi:hypothetical protein
MEKEKVAIERPQLEGVESLNGFMLVRSFGITPSKAS